MTNIIWYSTRGAGIVSLVLFTAVVVLGLLTASRFHGERWPRLLSEELHRSLALSSLIFLAIHVLTAVIDPYVSLGWAAALIPFAVDYRRLFLGLGSVALYLIATLIITSLLRVRIGHRGWRAVHWAAYAFWPISVIHAIGTGTDGGSLWMLAIVAGCVAAVGVAGANRLLDASRRRPLDEAVPAAITFDRSKMLNPSGFADGPRLEAGTTVPAEGPAGEQARRADRLLAGPPATEGAESYASHLARLGPLPLRGPQLIPVIEATGLMGRGGAGFPVGRKWRAVAQRSGGSAVVVANGAEGKPTSRKDRALMALRPHLVLDGALVAANAVGANEVILFIGAEHRPAFEAIGRALAERRDEIQVPVRLVEAPFGYVVGESSAAVHYINAGDARPTMPPPRTSERGIDGRPTLVQNVESLAYAALIARHGMEWYMSAGRGPTPGTALVTVSGTTPAQRVIEIEYGTPLGEVLERVGAWTTAGQGVILGDSFGAWADVQQARDLPLDPKVMRERGLAFGAGVIAVLPESTCGVVHTAQVMAYMAGESAGQCGPCVHGLRALAEATGRVAAGRPVDGDLARIRKWGPELAGRGACGLPDGALAFLESGLRVFADEFRLHERGGCSLGQQAARAATSPAPASR